MVTLNDSQVHLEDVPRVPLRVRVTADESITMCLSSGGPPFMRNFATGLCLGSQKRRIYLLLSARIPSTSCTYTMTSFESWAITKFIQRLPFASLRILRHAYIFLMARTSLPIFDGWACER